MNARQFGHFLQFQAQLEAFKEGKKKSAANPRVAAARTALQRVLKRQKAASH